MPRAGKGSEDSKEVRRGVVWPAWFLRNRWYDKLGAASLRPCPLVVVYYNIFIQWYVLDACRGEGTSPVLHAGFSHRKTLKFAFLLSLQMYTWILRSGSVASLVRRNPFCTRMDLQRYQLLCQLTPKKEMLYFGKIVVQHGRS